MKNIVIDLDGTLCESEAGNYEEARPVQSVITRLREYKAQGFNITIFTSRNMRTFDGAIGRINVETLPTILRWLDKHQVPHDEVLVGKPWCGSEGFYVDDRAIRPAEFRDLSFDQIARLMETGRCS